MTVFAQSEIAVHTEQPVFAFGESLLFEESVEATTGTLGPIAPSSTVDMIDRQKL